MNKFLSRKFIAMLGAILIVAGGYITGEISYSQAIWGAIAAILAYLGVEGAADIVSRSKCR